MIGQTISHYRTLAKLGGGGMGVVYKAEDTRLQRLVALKFLHPALTQDQHTKARFIREARAASALDHPNICTIHDIDEISIDGRDQLFIVMAYYEGETLQAKIARGSLPLQEALAIAVQIAEGLAKAHSHGIIHCDIKPANIMVTAAGLVKILDFGIARIGETKKATETGSIVGTVAYMSPEQIQSRMSDHRTDIWSLGVVLHEMLSGRPPFEGEHEMSTMYAIVSEEVDTTAFTSSVPTDLIGIVLKCLEKEQENRYDRTEQLLDDLRNIGKSAETIRPSPRPPAFLDGAKEQPEAPAPVFVAREKELAKLNEALDAALAANGRAVFVIGETGTGKTALTRAFARQAQGLHHDLIVASGKCNAHTGIGDPYLPFREVLSLLTGEVAAKWEVGALTAEHASRLWNLLPLVVRTLVDQGPALLDTFVSGEALTARALAYSAGRAIWLNRLRKLLERKAAAPVEVQQSDLFEQYTRVLLALARQQPVFLVLDDLQWTDPGSASLLFHLGRRLEGHRLLIVGAYRSEEVALGSEGARHPLEAVVNEFQRDFGDIHVDLNQAEGRRFVDAFLDTEPNRLDDGFRNALFQQTKGHALFTTEQVRGMQAQGMLIRDAKNYWIAAPALNWDTLPVRMEAVVQERLARLPENLRRVLTLAGVQGEEFTAEVISRVHGSGEREMVDLLSRELGKQHGLVSALGSERVGDQRLSHYRFQHIQFRNYLYNRLDEVERSYLHEEVGKALEALVGEHTESVAVALAHHFQQAGMINKAVAYLLQAGNRAAKLYATEAAIEQYKQGLALLKTLPDSSEKVHQELHLQLALGPRLIAVRGYSSPEVADVFARARELCQQIGETPELFTAIWLQFSFYSIQDYDTTRNLAEQLLNLAQCTQNPLQTAAAHYAMGIVLAYLGEHLTSREHFEKALAAFDPEDHSTAILTYEADLCVVTLTYLPIVLLFLGYPDQALKRNQEGVARARKLNHPLSLVFMLTLNLAFNFYSRKTVSRKEAAEEIFRISSEHGLVYFQSWGNVWLGILQAEEGQIDEGFARTRQGQSFFRTIGAKLSSTCHQIYLATACEKVGRINEGIAALDEALAIVEEDNERLVEAELYRVKGEFLLKRKGMTAEKNEHEAEACFQKALEVSRRQQTRLLELRTATSLSRLWLKQGKRKAALELLAPIYDWFTEGFGFPDLQEAKALIAQLEQEE